MTFAGVGPRLSIDELRIVSRQSTRIRSSSSFCRLAEISRLLSDQGGRVAWIMRLVKIGADGEEHFADPDQPFQLLHADNMAVLDPP